MPSFELRLISTITCFCASLLQQVLGVVLIHHVHAVADAFGVAQFHGLPDVEAQALGRHQPRRQFAGVQADVNLGIDGVQVVQHLHLQRVVAHGDKTVLGHDEVDADEAGLVRVHARLDGLKAQQRLRKDLLGREAAQHLIDDSGPRPGRRARPAECRSARCRGAAASAVRTSSRSAAISSRSPWSSSCCAIAGKAPAFTSRSRGRSARRGKRAASPSVRDTADSAPRRGWPPRPPTRRVRCWRPLKAVKGGEELVVPAEAGEGTKLRIEKASISRS